LGYDVALTAAIHWAYMFLHFDILQHRDGQTVGHFADR